MQYSHYFWAFFLKIYHTDGILVLSLALLLILRHAYSSMVHSRSPWSTGVPPCYQPLLPSLCYLDPASCSKYRETVFQLLCLALCLSVCILSAAAGGLCAIFQKHIVAATAQSRLFCRLWTNTAKASVWKVAWYHKN